MPGEQRDSIITAGAGGRRVRWTLWVDADAGRMILKVGESFQTGHQIEMSTEEAPYIAAALAEHCDDNDERAFVRDAWGDIDEPATCCPLHAARPSDIGRCAWDKEPGDA